MVRILRRCLAGLGTPPLWPRWFWPLFALGIVANILPLVVAPILPFNDLHGAAGLLGAWVQRPNPAARIDDYFVFNVHPAPNVIYWAVGWVLTRAFSVHAATNIFIAVFCVIALPVSFLCALRAFGKDPVLSFLAFPIIYHRCLWYGFMGSVPAVPLLLLTVAFSNLAFSHPRLSWRDAALSLVLLAMATAHAFLFLVAVGLTILWAMLALGQPSSLPRRLIVLLPSAAYIGPWLATNLFGRRSDGTGFGGVLAHAWKQRPAFATYLRNAHEWLINGYAGSIDEWVAAIFVATLLAVLIAGLRPPAMNAAATPPPPARNSPWSWRLPLSVGLLGVGYFLLPMTVYVPFGWWAVHVRLLVPFILLAALMTRNRRRGLPRWALFPVMGAAVIYGAFLSYDFRRWWTGVELDGFPDALGAIPPGKRVHALYPRFENERHYSHFPMGYIVDYAVVYRGGTAAPIMSGHPNELWVSWRRQGPGPVWGMASGFRWAAHAASWDYFLAKQPAPGNGPKLSLFGDAPPGAVRKIFEQGLWSVWKREQ